MILPGKTLEIFGYLPNSLSSGSTKKVIVQCDYCTNIVHKKYRNYLISSTSIIKKDACKNCKNKKAAEMVAATPGKKESMINNMVTTNIEKYGTSAPSNNEKINKKMRENNLLKYGVEHHIAAESTKKQIKKTMNEKYGADHHMSNTQYLTNFKQNMVNKYGVDNALDIPEVREKINKTIKERYGVNHNSQIHYSEECMNNLENKTWLYEQYVIQQKSLAEISEILGLRKDGHSTIAVWLKKHDIEIRNSCMVSRQEREIFSFIQSVYQGQIEQSNRTIIAPKELDIYIPEHNLAIEFCGLYWHSDEFIKDTKYHQNKYLECEKKGITLITVFEDEWNNNPTIIEGKIQHHLLQSFPVYARKCEIVNVSVDAEREFLNKHHIQGYVASKVCIGLEFKGTLIAIMSFGTPRYNKKYEYELLRYATDGSVVGGGSKLLTHFEKTYNPKTLISYCNLRYGSGKMYESLGFKYSHTSNPSYYYVKNGKRFNRQSLTKKKMIETYGFLDTQTEFQMAESLGYSKIYDCGNKVFVKSYTV